MRVKAEGIRIPTPAPTEISKRARAELAKILIFTKGN